jgi:ABC-type Na+ efflux pump permease subunit
VNLLPIVERELRTASRQWRTYLARSWAGGVALAFVMYILWVFRSAFGIPLTGAVILKFVSYIAFAFCAFGGMNRTADSLSSEKRDDTLGLLFLTNLRSHDIVLGKLIANSCRSFYVLLATIPVLSLPVMMGGVTSSEILRVPVSLLNALFFSLSVGLLVSALTRSQRAAKGISSFAIITFMALLPAASMLVEREWENPELALLLSIPSPTYAQEMSLAGTFGLRINYFWSSILVQLGISTLSICLACAILPHAWKIKSLTLRQLKWREGFRNWLLGSSKERLAYRTRLLARNPIFWLTCRERYGWLWALLVAIGSISVSVWVILHYNIPKEPAIVIATLTIGGIDLYLRGRAAGTVAQRIMQDRQFGALELILSTPLGVSDILKGLWMAVRKNLLWTYVSVLVLYLVGSVAAMTVLDGDWPNYLIVLMFALISVGDFIALGYVGAWYAVRFANPVQAPGLAVLRIIVAPWIVCFAVIALWGNIDTLRGYLDRSPALGFGLAFVIWLCSDLLAFFSVRRHIREHFRIAATDRDTLEQRVGWLPRLRRLYCRFSRPKFPADPSPLCARLSAENGER